MARAYARRIGEVDAWEAAVFSDAVFQMREEMAGDRSLGRDLEEMPVRDFVKIMNLGDKGIRIYRNVDLRIDVVGEVDPRDETSGHYEFSFDALDPDWFTKLSLDLNRVFKLREDFALLYNNKDMQKMDGTEILLDPKRGRAILTAGDSKKAPLLEKDGRGNGSRGKDLVTNLERLYGKDYMSRIAIGGTEKSKKKSIANLVSDEFTRALNVDAEDDSFDASMDEEAYVSGMKRYFKDKYLQKVYNAAAAKTIEYFANDVYNGRAASANYAHVFMNHLNKTENYGIYGRAKNPQRFVTTRPNPDIFAANIRGEDVASGSILGGKTYKMFGESISAPSPKTSASSVSGEAKTSVANTDTDTDVEMAVFNFWQDAGLKNVDDSLRGMSEAFVKYLRKAWQKTAQKSVPDKERDAVTAIKMQMLILPDGKSYYGNKMQKFIDARRHPESESIKSSRTEATKDDGTSSSKRSGALAVEEELSGVINTASTSSTSNSGKSAEKMYAHAKKGTGLPGLMPIERTLPGLNTIERTLPGLNPIAKPLPALNPINKAIPAPTNKASPKTQPDVDILPSLMRIDTSGSHKSQDKNSGINVSMQKTYLGENDFLDEEELRIEDADENGLIKSRITAKDRQKYTPAELEMLATLPPLKVRDAADIEKQKEKEKSMQMSRREMEVLDKMSATQPIGCGCGDEEEEGGDGDSSDDEEEAKEAAEKKEEEKPGEKQGLAKKEEKPKTVSSVMDRIQSSLASGSRKKEGRRVMIGQQQPIGDEASGAPQDDRDDDESKRKREAFALGAKSPGGSKETVGSKNQGGFASKAQLLQSQSMTESYVAVQGMNLPELTQWYQNREQKRAEEEKKKTKGGGKGGDIADLFCKNEESKLVEAEEGARVFSDLPDNCDNFEYDFNIYMKLYNDDGHMNRGAVVLAPTSDIYTEKRAKLVAKKFGTGIRFKRFIETYIVLPKESEDKPYIAAGAVNKLETMMKYTVDMSVSTDGLVRKMLGFERPMIGSAYMSKTYKNVYFFPHGNHFKKENK